MNTLLPFVTFFFLLIWNSQGAVYQMGPYSSEHPGHCYSKLTGPMEANEMKTIKGCQRAECVRGGSIEIASCGISNCPPTAAEAKKPYPDCCQGPICYSEI